MSYQSETDKYRVLTVHYCYRADGRPGCGIDLASQGDPVVPWAWQLELPEAEFDIYNDYHPIRSPVNLRGDAFARFVEDGSLDFIYVSHLLEDRPYEEWPQIMRNWNLALKPLGNLILLCPERELWAEAIRNGQCPNCAHKYEPVLGDLTKAAEQSGFTTEVETLTNLFPGDYSILYVGRKGG
jgi:hypothetical protein